MPARPRSRSAAASRTSRRRRRPDGRPGAARSRCRTRRRGLPCARARRAAMTRSSGRGARARARRAGLLAAGCWLRARAAAAGKEEDGARRRRPAAGASPACRRARRRLPYVESARTRAHALRALMVFLSRARCRRAVCRHLIARRASLDDISWRSLASSMADGGGGVMRARASKYRAAPAWAAQATARAHKRHEVISLFSRRAARPAAAPGARLPSPKSSRQRRGAICRRRGLQEDARRASSHPPALLWLMSAALLFMYCRACRQRAAANRLGEHHKQQANWRGWRSMGGAEEPPSAAAPRVRMGRRRPTETASSSCPYLRAPPFASRAPAQQHQRGAARPRLLLAPA